MCWIGLLLWYSNSFSCHYGYKSLHTNAGHQEGLNCFKTLLFRQRKFYTPDWDWQTLTIYIFFLFIDEAYIQKIRGPMGSCFSPNYACLFSGLWGKEYVLNHIYSFHCCITWCGSCIDDVLMLFDGSETPLITDSPLITLSIAFIFGFKYTQMG